MKLVFDPDTVKSISPHEVNVTHGVRVTEVCDAHQKARGQDMHWLLFEAPGYNDIADTICVLTYEPPPPRRPLNVREAIGQPVLRPPGQTVTAARITGLARDDWRAAVEKAKPKDVVPFPTGCGCKAEKMSDEEVAGLVQGKTFPCEYASGHLVDER